MVTTISNLLLSIAVLFLLGGGIYFSIKMHFPQFKFNHLFKGFTNKNNNSISPFKTLMMSLAARVGVGSLAGIALAIYLGGPGTIFWIWVTCLITSINTFCESYLGAKYQQYDKDNYIGGPSYYMEKGLKNKKLAIIYALLVIIAYIIGFMTIQANTITVSLYNYYKIRPIIIALLITIITAYSISNVNRIVNITSKIVPLMGISYILLGIIIIIMNYNLIPNILMEIVTDALNIKKTLPVGLIASILIGIQRGVFSTEAGLGTSSIASSCTYAKDKISLGLMQILGVYFTVFIVCTITALIILTSDYNQVIFTNFNGIELTQYALNYHLGKIGSVILIISIIFLAYSTIVAGYYYGESCLKYLLKNVNNYHLFLLKGLTLILLLIGSLVSANYLWKIVDIAVETLAIVNMYALFKMRREILFDYNHKK